AREPRRMVRLRNALVLPAALASLGFTGFTCVVNSPEAPHRGPATIHIVVSVTNGEHASNVRVQLERLEHCGFFSVDCRFATAVETRAGLSNNAGDLFFDDVTPGTGRLTVIAANGWIPAVVGGEFEVFAGDKVEKSASVMPARQ